MKLDAANFENEHVRLEPLTEDDRKLIADSGAIKAMWSWMPVIGTGTHFDAYFDHIINRVYKIGDAVAFKVICKVNNEFAGMVGYDEISRTHRRLRIGYPWHPENMRGTVVPPATQLAMLERAKAARFRRIEYLITDNNPRAIAFVEGLGASKEGTMRNYFRLTGGGWANMVVLSLVDKEIDGAIKLISDRVHEIAAA